MQIPYLNSLTKYFKIFYRYAGKKLFVIFILIFLAGISEGFGLSMALPLLNLENQEASSAYSKFIYRMLEGLGLEISLNSVLFFLVFSFFLKGIFTFVQEVIGLYVRTNVIELKQVEVCEKYSTVSYDFFANKNIGFLNNIITAEVHNAMAALDGYIHVVSNVLFTMIFLSIAFAINLNMTLFVLVICLPVFFMIKSLSRVSRQSSLLVTKTNAEIQSLLIQILYNFKYLKATASFASVMSQLFHKIRENLRYKFKRGVLVAIPKSITEPMTILFLVGLIYYHVGVHGKPMADIFVLLVFFHKAFGRVFSFQSTWIAFNAKLGGIEVVETVLSDLNRYKETTGDKTLNNLCDKIQLENIDFSYGSKQILKNINITIQKNKSIGIVGESGAGKTTLFDILTGLLVPQSGTISIDGIRYNELNIQSLRSLIAYVTQEPVIFNDSIANNISFWQCDSNEKAGMGRIRTAAELSNCISFIQNTESGFETVLGDKGVKLSGGQKQRIAIAREIFKDPQIIIFDEATSSLDTESEALIQKSIKKMMGKKTIILIAHRLSTIKNCDYIYVLSKGEIVEEGEVSKLYENKRSRFYGMCKAQNL